MRNHNTDTTALEQGLGLTGRNFRKIAPNGFGDPQNCYPHGMTWFKDYLFVGTTRANLANRAKQISSLTPEKLGEIWPVRIPESYFDNDLRAEIWRYHPPTDAWKRVFVSPIVKGVDGFDVPVCVGFRCMTPFQGTNDAAPALYAPTWGSHQTPGTLMLRSEDGDSFEVVSEPGLGIEDNKPRSLRGIVPFKGRLFTSPVVGQKRLEPNIAGSAIVYASSTPNGGKWEVACEPFFGDRNNVSVFHMAAFHDHLYAGTLNVHEGFQIWKTDGEGKPPFKWKKVLGNGAYRGKLNQMAMTLVPFKDHMYVGSAIQNCSWDFDNNIGPAPPEILRLAPDDSWDLLVGEPRLTPQGLKVPLSGLGPGFGNPFSGYLWAMCEHDGWLYAATAVWAVFLRFAGREERWPKHMRGVFSRENIEKIIHHIGGCDLWRTRDGHRWLPVTSNGFGNYFNIGFRNMVSSPYGLFVGAANPFAPQVAVRRVAGWNYEDNPRGALEIWHGVAPATGVEQKEAQSAAEKVIMRRSSLISDKRADTSGEVEKVIADFYGNSGFRHYGFWKIGVKDAGSACENLLDELLAFLPDKTGKVVDVACGQGATTRYLLKHFPRQAVTGITRRKVDLGICRQVAPDVTFLLREGARLNLPADTFDTAMYVKGFDDPGPRRKFIREIFHTLKAGGRYVSFDLLADGPVVTGLWQKIKSAQGQVDNLKIYQELLEKEGFTDIRIFDVTGQCGESFQRHVARYFGLRKISGDIQEEVARQAETMLLPPPFSGRRSLLVTCVKPGSGEGR